MKKIDLQKPYEIVQWPDKILMTKTKKLNDFSNLDKKVNRAILSMNIARGLGIAAPQCGISERWFIINIAALPDDEVKKYKNMGMKDSEVFVNPEFCDGLGEVVVIESCLSNPGYEAYVQRCPYISVKYKDLCGVEKTVDLSGMASIAFQHELDHLDGKTIMDNRINT